MQKSEELRNNEHISTLYINKIADSILFDEKNKEFTICDGSLGTYKFCDVVTIK